MPGEWKAYRKHDPAEEETQAVGKKKGKRRPKDQDEETLRVQEHGSADEAVSPGSHKSKGKKYVPLYEKSTVMLPGRHRCECQARKHDLIGNCINCGRVVCAQEKSGPCLFCGTLVVTPAEREILGRQSRKSVQLMEKLTKEAHEYETGLQAAEAHKEKLLNYDRNQLKRTRVFDDEADYFQSESNKWLSPEQRAKLAQQEKEAFEKKHASRRLQKIVVDLAGRRVVEEVQERPPEEDVMTDEDLAWHLSTRIKNLTLENPTLEFPKLEFTPNTVGFLTDEDRRILQRGLAATSDVLPAHGSRRMKIQDLAALEMRDDGFCLSMHQPFASLLVRGIKKHEGRTWYSGHRGRLWIAAASKNPSVEEVKDIENFYIRLHKNKHLSLPFPEHYPISCLLGYVDVVDVLSQEEYRERFPDGESESPYVFVCENPHELVVKFPVSGQHKIYSLDKAIHQAAIKAKKTQFDV